MIGWMQNWAFVNQHAETEPWFGQMALPRELSIVDGKLIQRPTKEFDALRKNPVSHNGVCVSGLEAVKLEGIEGRVADVELTIAPKARTTVTICLKCVLHRMTSIIQHFAIVRMSLSLS